MFNNREVAGCLCVRYKREKEIKKTKKKIRILIEHVIPSIIVSWRPYKQSRD